MGWRWGSQESASLTFWFQLAWGLWFLSSDGDFSICKTAQRYCYVLPLRGNQVLHQGCTNVYRLLLPCICILSLPWLTTVLTCPLELREGHEDWSLFPVIKRSIGHKDFCAQEPCRKWVRTRFHWDVRQWGESLACSQDQDLCCRVSPGIPHTVLPQL